MRANSMDISAIRRAAALDNAELCAAMWRAHGLGVERFDGCVASTGTPPKFYPNVVTVDPAVDTRDQIRGIAERAELAADAFCVKDSYQALALDRVGFEPLFEARWIHRAAGLAAGPPRCDWRPVTGADELSAWEAAWNGGAKALPLFTPAFLAAPGVSMMGGWRGGTILAGCIITTMGAVAGLSNIFGDASETIRAAARACADLDLVGYESGDALATALEAGFETIGPLVVWRRA